MNRPSGQEKASHAIRVYVEPRLLPQIQRAAGEGNSISGWVLTLILSALRKRKEK